MTATVYSLSKAEERPKRKVQTKKKNTKKETGCCMPNFRYFLTAKGGLRILALLTLLWLYIQMRISSPPIKARIEHGHSAEYCRLLHKQYSDVCIVRAGTYIDWSRRFEFTGAEIVLGVSLFAMLLRLFQFRDRFARGMTIFFLDFAIAGTLNFSLMLTYAILVADYASAALASWAILAAILYTLVPLGSLVECCELGNCKEDEEDEDEVCTDPKMKQAVSDHDLV